jgi:hypothetical protein
MEAAIWLEKCLIPTIPIIAIRTCSAISYARAHGVLSLQHRYSIGQGHIVAMSHRPNAGPRMSRPSSWGSRSASLSSRAGRLGRFLEPNWPFRSKDSCMALPSSWQICYSTLPSDNTRENRCDEESAFWRRFFCPMPERTKLKCAAYIVVLSMQDSKSGWIRSTCYPVSVGSRKFLVPFVAPTSS